MMCYAYEIIANNKNLNIMILAPIKKLEENTFFFGKYKELDVSIL